MEVQELLIHPAPPKSLNDVNKDKDTNIHFVYVVVLTFCPFVFYVIHMCIVCGKERMIDIG